MPVLSLTDSYTSLVAATLVHRSKGYKDAITKQLPVFWWMIKKKQYKPYTGRRIEWAVQYKLKGGEKSYQGFDLFDLQEFDNVTVAYANWKAYQEAIVIGGLDMDVYNTGKEKVFDLADQKEKAALGALQTAMSADMYADGTGNDGKDITGFDATIPEDPTTGTLFGFNRATAGNEWMRSILVDSGSGGAAVAAYSGTPVIYKMIIEMAKVRQQAGRLKIGEKKNQYPDVCFCTEGYLLAYESCLLHMGRVQITNMSAADAGFNNLVFNGVTLMDDQDCPQDRTNTGNGETGIWVNSAFYNVAYAPKRDFKMTGLRQPINQDAYAGHILWAGEHCPSVMPKHARHIGIKQV